LLSFVVALTPPLQKKSQIKTVNLHTAVVISKRHVVYARPGERGGVEGKAELEPDGKTEGRTEGTAEGGAGVVWERVRVIEVLDCPDCWRLQRDGEE
jgi:hypothetical protein